MESIDIDESSYIEASSDAKPTSSLSEDGFLETIDATKDEPTSDDDEPFFECVEQAHDRLSTDVKELSSLEDKLTPSITEDDSHEAIDVDEPSIEAASISEDGSLETIDATKDEPTSDYECVEQAHHRLSTDVKEPSSLEDKPKVRFIVKTERPDTMLSHIGVHIKNWDKPVKALLDSGAVVSAVSEDCLPADILPRPMTERLNNFVGFAGECKAIGMVDLDVEIGPMVTQLKEVPVFRNIPFELVLGVDWRNSSMVNLTTFWNGDVEIEQVQAQQAQNESKRFTVALERQGKFVPSRQYPRDNIRGARNELAREWFYGRTD